MPQMVAVGMSISRMPGPALRPLIADHDHVARLDRTARNALYRLFLAVEHDRRARIDEHFRRDRAALDHAAVRREVTFQNGETARL